MGIHNTLQQILNFLNFDIVFSKDKMVDSVYTLVGMKSLEDLEFKESNDPHGERVDAFDLEPSGVLVAT